MPEHLHAAAMAEAERRGMTLNDLIGEFLADLTGVPYTDQEALKSA